VVVVADMLAFVGLVWMAWGRLFSQQSGLVPFQAPLAALPIVTTPYSFLPRAAPALLATEQTDTAGT
jgi:hypothetical protein